MGLEVTCGGGMGEEVGGGLEPGGGRSRSMLDPDSR
jgi:hypothetical protein